MFYSLQRLLRRIRRRKELSAAFLVVIIIAAIAGNTLTYVAFDDASIPDGLWYSIVSITTIGYGDVSSSSFGSRIGTVFFIILVGLATFTTAIGMIVDWIVDLRQKERTGMGRQGVRDHLIIVNFPGEDRVRQIIEEFKSDTRHRDREIVLVTHEIEALPFQIDRVSFVRGWPLDQDTYERANLAHARLAIILSTGYEDPRSDSMVASIAFVINSANPAMSVVAECLNPKHAVLFNVSDRVSLVYPLRMANNLLVHEAQDPGVTKLAHAITSNEIEGTLASTAVDSDPASPMRYTEVAKGLLDHGVNLVGFIRNGDVAVDFGELEVSRDDSLVYVSRARHTWAELSGFLA